MPIFRNKVLAGSEFDGTATKGLFQHERIGPDYLQVQVNSLLFHTSASTAFVLSFVDPTDSDNKIVFLSGSGTDFSASSWFLPTEQNASWSMVFETTGMVGDGWLTIDYDIVRTP